MRPVEFAKKTMYDKIQDWHDMYLVEKTIYLRVGRFGQATQICG